MESCGNLKSTDKCDEIKDSKICNSSVQKYTNHRTGKDNNFPCNWLEHRNRCTRESKMCHKFSASKKASKKGKKKPSKKAASKKPSKKPSKKAASKKAASKKAVSKKPSKKGKKK